MKKTFLLLLNFYQKTISPDHGIFKQFRSVGVCKFYPTCSEYAKQAITRHRTRTALYVILKRILRCNPFSHGGVDEI